MLNSVRSTFGVFLLSILIINANGCSNINSKRASDFKAEESHLNNEISDSAQPQAKRKPIIGTTFLGLNEFPATIMKTMIEDAKKRDVTLLVYNGKDNVQEQISNIEDMINKGVDIIILNPVDAEGCVKCVQLANESGIPILGVNAMVNTDKLLTYVGSNDLEAGEIEMKFMGEKMKGEGNIIVMDGITSQSSQMQRTQGILNTLRSYPRIKILEEKSANWTREEGYSLMQSCYEKYGKKINAVVSQNDEMALGAIKFLEQNKLIGTIPVIGVDAIPDALKAVNDGKLDATVYQDAEGQGKLALDLAIKIFNKESIARTYYIPFKLVTKENIGQYIKE